MNREHIIREAFFAAETLPQRQRALDLMMRLMAARQKRARRLRYAYPPGS